MPLAPPIDAIQQPSVGIYGLPVGASAGAMVLLTAAQIRAHADLSGYVPYTGATGAVNLGANGLTCGAITASGAISTTSTYVDIGPAAGLRLRHDGANSYLTTSIGTMTVGTTASTSLVVQTVSNTRLTVDNVGNFTFLGGKVVFAYTGGITSTGNLTLQNSTTAVIETIEKTYTSATSREYIQSGWNATDSAYDVGVSYQGSAGGSLQAVRIGNRTAAGVFSGLTVATSGAVTLGGLTINPANSAVTFSQTFAISLQTSNALILRHGHGDTTIVRTVAGTVSTYSPAGYGALSLGNTSNAIGAYFAIPSAGTLAIRTAAHGDAALTCGAITASGAITVGPPSAGYSSQIHKGINSYGLALGYSNTSTPGTTFNFEFGNARFQIVGSAAQLQAGPILGNADLIFGRNSTGPAWKSQSVGGLQVRNLADSADASFTCGAITASGTILTQNGTSPTSIQITNTYTSATSFGLLDIRANAAQTAYEISSFLGSAGGANLPINIGHRSSGGTFTSALSVATSGTITVASGFVSSNWTRIAGSDLPERGIAVRDSQLSLASNVGIYWSTALDPTNNQNGGTIKMLSGVLTISGQITHVPPTSSVTLGTNGQFSIEMTSDTAGNLVYRGSDGTTRRAALVFV